ncbi:copper resistance protein NlpE [Muribacter muris]|uniref:Copper resistance protein NlpE n=1 Tax=Muribacter muris TaxID=67855 RepID=A0A4Y9JWG7_9PAST|nr:copper resistance protein NlpE [Muribacter muris]MBF0785092.1 copper resistance protein NlpE N-terminal domain-containing protein [Muribacter muris]MBF0826894.1 copper resistance protein NlpE N-terminal domain-containing protein [Muribacter muris]TFV10184.1 copper resistance protein NlpE [Muribacter muris]
MKKIILMSIATLLSACSTLSPKSVSGTYEGTLPCADCEKIEAKLVLNADSTYQYNTLYFKNKEKHPFIEKGTYTWDGNKKGVIRLTNSGNLAVKLSDTFVEFCDANGETSKSGNNYKLHKTQ